jgi:hypothetical protein
MKIEKKDAIKSLWLAIEDTIKALKALAENPVVTNVSQLWDSVDTYKISLRNLLECNHIIFGRYYKCKHYNDEWIIYKAEAFTSQDNQITLKATVVTSSKKNFKYEIAKDQMFFQLEHIRDSEEIDLDPKDLPLYVNNEFNGQLFKELLTKAGLEPEE